MMEPEEQKYNIKKVDDYRYIYNYNQMNVTVVGDEPTEDFITYGNNLVNIYQKNKDAIINYVYENLKKMGKVQNRSKEEVQMLLKNPEVIVILNNAGLFNYYRNRLGLTVSINLDGYKLTEVIISE